MKAIVLNKYGTIDNLYLDSVVKPAPQKKEVLIKVHAASVNDWDWGILRGKPFMIRMMFGIFNPKKIILGTDVAGVVEAVGDSVTKFKPGDEVYGDLSESSFGSFAEYVCANEMSVRSKPDHLTFTQAAALPHSGVLAMQPLYELHDVKPGDSVLINGAGGGAGTLAIQIAKLKGAIVTAVDKSEKLKTMKSLGADYVLDYTIEDYTANGKQYDLVVSYQENHSIFQCRYSVKKGGVFTMVGGATSRMFQLLFVGAILSKLYQIKMCLLMHAPNRYLDILEELVRTNRVSILIDKTYTLPQVPEALQYFGNTDSIGKLVVTVNE